MYTASWFGMGIAISLHVNRKAFETGFGSACHAILPFPFNRVSGREAGMERPQMEKHC